MTNYPIGTRVRLIHHRRPGTVCSDVYVSDVDGGPRQDVRWDIVMPDEPIAHTTGWDPAFFVRLDQMPIDDAPFVVSHGIIFAEPGLVTDGAFIGKLTPC